MVPLILKPAQTVSNRWLATLTTLRERTKFYPIRQLFDALTGEGWNCSGSIFHQTWTCGNPSSLTASKDMANSQNWKHKVTTSSALASRKLTRNMSKKCGSGGLYTHFLQPIQRVNTLGTHLYLFAMRQCKTEHFVLVAPGVVVLKTTLAI